jgi:uncharacterized UBP type Zn finger protein
MKISIHYQKEKINLSVDKEVTIRELLKYLRKEFKIDEEYNLFLCNDEKLYDNNEFLTKNNEEIVLVSTHADKPQKGEIKLPIEELIQVTTDAETAMQKLKPCVSLSQKFGHARMAIEINPESIQTLTAMGFPENRARTALHIQRGDVQRAADLLLNSDESLDADEDEVIGRVALNNRRGVFEFLSRRRNAEVNLESNIY